MYPIETQDGTKMVVQKSYVGEILVLNTEDGGMYVDGPEGIVAYDAEAIEASKTVGGGAGESTTEDATEAAERAATAAGINAGQTASESETEEASAGGEDAATGEETPEEPTTEGETGPETVAPEAA